MDDVEITSISPDHDQVRQASHVHSPTSTQDTTHDAQQDGVSQMLMLREFKEL
jgi:hypothetical protein